MHGIWRACRKWLWRVGKVNSVFRKVEGQARGKRAFANHACGYWVSARAISKLQNQKDKRSPNCNPVVDFIKQFPSKHMAPLRYPIKVLHAIPWREEIFRSNFAIVPELYNDNCRIKNPLLFQSGRNDIHLCANLITTVIKPRQNPFQPARIFELSQRRK